MNNKIEKIIVENRKKLKISQRELARRVGIDNAYLSRIEKGEIKKPSVNILQKLSKELNLNILDLLFMTYNTDEIETIGIFGNINDVYHFIDEEELEKFIIIDENNNKRLSIIKILEEYKKDKIDTNKMIGLLSCLTNKNFYNYLTKDEIEKIHREY